MATYTAPLRDMKFVYHELFNGDDLQKLPGYADFRYDYLADREERVAAALPLLHSWQRSALSRRRRDPELLVDAEGKIRVDAFRRLLNQRDTRPLFLRE